MGGVTADWTKELERWQRRPTSILRWRSLSSVAFRLRRRHRAEIVPAVTSRLRTVEQLPLARDFHQHVFAKQPHTLGASEIGMVEQPEAEIMTRLRGEITEQSGVIVAHEARQIGEAHSLVQRREGQQSIVDKKVVVAVGARGICPRLVEGAAFHAHPFRRRAGAQ